MKRRLDRALAIIGSAAVLAAAAPAGAAPSAPASRYASIVIEAETGVVLYERNADLPRYPASLTKIMTLYLTFEALASKKLSLTDELVMTPHAAGQDPSRLDLAPGSRIKVEDAIRAMTTKSANDAACAIAERLGKGSEARFADAMTAKAKALGLKQTTFHNASGLPCDGHLSSARDMALLSKALVRDFPEQYSYFSTGAFEFKGTRYPNQNKFLRTYYGADGIKTGFVNASGHNLAASAIRGGKRLIAIVLGGDTQKWTREHTTRLLDVAYAKIDPSLVMVASNATTPSGTTPGSPTPAAATAAATPAGAAPVAAYATPAGAVEVAAAIPLPNATANLTAYASATTAPGSPAGSVPSTPPQPAQAGQPPAAAVPAAKPGAVVAAAQPAAAPKTAPSPNPATAAASSTKPAAQPATPVAATTVPAKPSPAAPSATATASDKPARPAPPSTTAAASKPPQAAATLTVHAEKPLPSAKIAAPVPKPSDAPAAAPAPAPAPAKPEPSAAATPAHPPEEPAAQPGEDWSVQVGLFRDATIARRRGEEARNLMPLSLRDANLVVGRAVDGVHVTSRLSSLSEQDARAACSELQRGRVPCVVVPPGRPMVVATN